MLHIGVDLHKRVTQFAILHEDGVVQQRRLDNEGDSVEKFLEGLEPSKLAVEATGTWWWFVDLAEKLGHEVVLSNPKQTRAIAAARLKNDRVDAERLALLLRGDLLPEVWIAPPAMRQARELFRHRVALVWLRTEVKNRLQSMLARRNLKLKTAKSWFTPAGHREMDQMILTPEANRIREDSWQLLERLDSQIREVDQEMQRRWADDDRVRRLMSIPGIGLITATAIVVELGDIQRFSSAKHLASYVGLTPRVRSSADRTKNGHISREGNRLLRWLLVEAALHASRQNGPLKAVYRRLQQRKGNKIARVALARHLTEIVYHVWKKGVSYQATLRCGGGELGSAYETGSATILTSGD